MSRQPKQTPIEQRRGQIERELEKLRLPKNQKTRRDFKSDDSYENWKEKQGVKFLQLNEEMIILDNPTEYNEIPLAIAATELGVTLNEMLGIVNEELVGTSFDGEFRAGARITREELARAIEIGADELVRISEQSVEEIFEEGLVFLHNGNLEAAERANERIEKFGYDAHQFSIPFGIGLELLRSDFDALSHSFWFVDSYDEMRLAAILDKLRRVVEGIEPTSHLSAMVREQILAVAEGKKQKPFERTYSSYESTEFFSQMDENQRHAMMLASVVLAAIEKYNFKKRLSKWSGWASTPKDEEMERVIRNAIYTALEAESTYYDSPSSKLFVDKFVELFPKRWIPAERIALLPKNEKVKLNKS
jgi:hypothetical protein